ncbi:MAG: hypothetical protein AAGI88_09805 [Pseudomonadota bacterium]
MSRYLEGADRDQGSGVATGERRASTARSLAATRFADAVLPIPSSPYATAGYTTVDPIFSPGASAA